MPADVPDELAETWLRNMAAATNGTGRLNLFACDQKIEHLNDDFHGEGIPLGSNNPGHLFEIGSRAHAEGTLGVLAGQCGLISMYGRDHPDLPYLVKLNSKTNLVKTSQRDPRSLAMWDIDDALALIDNGLNVVGIGYTVYLGSEYEHEMLTEAATFIRQAHEHGMISVVWMYPRVRRFLMRRPPSHRRCLPVSHYVWVPIYLKVNHPNGGSEEATEALKVAVEAAGRTGIICSGGGSLPPRDFLQRLWDQINLAGARGAATGRNIHQRETLDAVSMTAACHAIICEGASVEEAMAIYERQ